VFLEVREISVRYGTVEALSGVSFSIGPGEIVALLGPNGAGKSTALKAACGGLGMVGGEITHGEVWFEETPITTLRTDQLVRRGISLVPEGRRVFGSLSVLENLQMGAYTLIGKSNIRERIEHVLNLFPQLQDRIRLAAASLSTGEQQMLAIARGLVVSPRLLMADEPSLGLSPKVLAAVADKLVEVNSAGTAILLVEQNVSIALQLCHRAYVFEAGRIVLDGARADLLDAPDFRRVFLGG
jgi:branched-chain amino acid transport system ATP-binding protein